MEPGEAVRFNPDEHTRSITRRLSSILKAPRTPLKALGTENEDHQEEQTQKIEKKRKYKRVSFATTNDTRYISSPGKNEDPDITGTDCQKERNGATENVSQQIIGMETLLNAPLHDSQQDKENMFHPDVQHNDADKTVLFSGEDSAFMDMTHCHTIIIDANAHEISSASSCGVDDLASELRAVKSTDYENPLNSDSIFYSGPTASKIQIQKSEMGDCLASFSKASCGTSTGSRKPASMINAVQYSEESSSGPKTDVRSFFCKLAAQSALTDKENQNPTTGKLNCDERAARSFPSKENALDFDCTMVFSNGDNMDMTQSHTVFIDGREIWRPKFGRNMEATRAQTIEADVSQLIPEEKFSKFDQDDMEMTGSQTVVIDAHVNHGLFNPTLHSRKSMSTSSEMLPVSENDAGMVTKTGNVRSGGEIKHYPTENKANVKLFPAVNPVSQWVSCSASQYDDLLPGSKLDARVLFSRLGQNSVAGKENETPESLREPQYDRNNQAAVVPSDPDDMEMTRSQTVVIGMTNPVLVTAKKSSCKENFSEEDYGMEMTTAFTLPIEENCPVVPSGHKALGQFLPTKPAPYGELPGSGGMTADQSTGWIAGSSDVDMEMTRSQTVVIDSKNSWAGLANSSHSDGRKSFIFVPKDKTVNFSEDDNGMDMTTAFTLPIEENCHVATSGDKVLGLFSPTRPVSHTDLHASRETTINQAASAGSSVWTAESSDADMEMTKCQTVVIDSKTSGTGLVNLSHSEGRASFCIPKDKTVIFSEKDYGMEMTAALNLPIEENCPVTTSDHKALDKVLPVKSVPYKGPSCSHWMTVDQAAAFGLKDWNTGSSDVDMEMTKCHTIVIDSKTSSTEIANLSYSDRRRSFSCLPKDKTLIFSEENYGMDMTTALTLPIEENCHLSTSVNKTEGLIPVPRPTPHADIPSTSSAIKVDQAIPGGHSVWTAGFSDADMEMTKCQTVVIDSKTFGTEMVTSSQSGGTKRFSFMPKDETVIFSEEDYNMDMTAALTLPIENNNHIPTTGDKTVERKTPVLKSSSDSKVRDERKLTANQVASAEGRVLATASSYSQDMEMETKTAFHSEKLCAEITNPLLRSRKKTESCRSGNKSDLLSDKDCAMDITAPLTLPVKYEQSWSVKGCKEMAEAQCAAVAGVEAHVNGINGATSMFSDFKKASGPTFGIDPRNPKRDSLFRNETRSRLDASQMSLSCETFIFSKEDNEMEMTTAGTVPTDGHDIADATTTTTSDFNLDLNVTHNAPPVADKQAADITERSSAPVDHFSDGNDDFAIDCADAMSKGLDCSVKKGDSLSTDPLVSNQKEKKIVKAINKNSRRISLADIKSQLGHIKDMITEPGDIVNRCLTAPLPQLGSDFETKETILESRTCSPNKENYNTQSTSKEHETNLWEDSAVHKQHINMTAPVNFWERKPLVTRMAFGGFLPKLPQKAKVDGQNHSEASNFAGLRKKSVDSVDQCGTNAVENIEDEILPEISSEEDLTETLESRVQAHTCVQENPSSGNINQSAVDQPGFVESVQNVMQGQKRSLPEEDHEETVSVERKMRRSPDSKCGSSVTDIAEENLPSIMSKTLDTVNISNSTTFMRADGTFETSVQRSQYDTDFEAAEYEHDPKKKLEDGSITVREFLKIFGIDFVIHRPRQSVLPDNFALAQKAEDLFVEKYINRPKQRVYEDETQELSKMVEKLKSRMWEQDKPLKTINHSFWEAVKTYSEEQFKALGSKLKERKVYFRKKSKALSHEMKKGLYISLVQTTQLAEQDLKEKIADVDDLLKNLDECLQDIQAELDLLENEGMSEVNVNSSLLCTLEAREQEFEVLNTAVTEKERIVENLQLEKSNTQEKISNMVNETKELEKYKTVTDRLIEWKLCEKTADRVTVSFLYGSVQLEVLFETHADETEQTGKVVKKVGDIKFHLQLDERNSEDYACLVHRLIAQFIHNKCDWVTAYPTESDIPLLLHDVSLVVSRCRALGEEIRRLKKWGSLKLDILEITCRDTQVKVVFSCLKVSAKFEITLVVTPAYPVSSLHVLHFQNYIGNTRMCQIEDIVHDITPSKNYLTRIVKKIHEALLS